MGTFIIGLELSKRAMANESQLERFGRRIAEISGTHRQLLESTWIAVATLTAMEIRDKLAQAIDEDARLLVVEVKHFGAWHGLSVPASDWLLAHL